MEKQVNIINKKVDDNENIKSGYFWLNELIKNRDKFMFKESDTLKTNITLFDDYTNGLVKQQLYILAARPAVGKTTFALNTILRSLKNLKNNEIIIFISLEMSAKEILNRILTLLNSFNFGINIDDLLNSKKLLIIDYSNSNVSNTKNLIDNLQKDYVIKSLFIDHLQLLELSKTQSNLPRYEKMTQITRELKIIAREKNINIFAISQLSRDFEKRNSNNKNDVEVQLSDLRDSGSIEQDADVVFFLAKLKATDEYDNKHCVYIAKNRNGSCSKIKCLFFPKKFLFTFIEDSKHLSCYACKTKIDKNANLYTWNKHILCSQKCLDEVKTWADEFELPTKSDK